MELMLEVNETHYDRAPFVTPPVEEGYWLFRVRLSDTQAILGFAKFRTIGIGFAVEAEDWNTNLPYNLSTSRILDHIRSNKGDEAIADADCLRAIEMVRDAATAYRKATGRHKEATS